MPDSRTPSRSDAHAAMQPMPDSIDPPFVPPVGLADRIAFARGFLRDPNGVGSVVPSSRWLERRLVGNLRLADARCVVELGPGTGGTTRAVLRALGPQARMLAIELDPGFAGFVRDTVRDPRLSVECGSAERIEAFLAARRLPAPDAIVSGIPFSTMPADVGDRIARAIAAALPRGGRFVAYQWTPVVADRLTPYLGKPRREWELLNLPPLRVFTWIKG
jgi:phospholipid N-methyltransferase